MASLNVPSPRTGLLSFHVGYMCYLPALSEDFLVLQDLAPEVRKFATDCTQR